MPGRADDLCGVALLDDDASVHENDLVSGSAGEAYFVCNDNHGHALGSEGSHNVEDVTSTTSYDLFKWHAGRQ
jgi:hypothetical protein